MSLIIPNDTLQTSQLDQNTDQLPGADNTDSARVQLLEAVQALKSILAGYGGSELFGTGNVGEIAFKDVTNYFTQTQVIRRSDLAPVFILDDISVANDFNPYIAFRTGGTDAAGSILQNVNSVANGYFQIYRSDASSTRRSILLMYEDGTIVLETRESNGALRSRVNLNNAGDIILEPAAGRGAYLNSNTAPNAIIRQSDLDNVTADFVRTDVPISISATGGSATFDPGFATNDYSWGISGIAKTTGDPSAVDAMFRFRDGANFEDWFRFDNNDAANVLPVRPNQVANVVSITGEMPSGQGDTGYTIRMWARKG